MSFENILCYGTLNPDLIYFVDKLPDQGDDIRSSNSKIRAGGTAINCSELIALWNKPVHVRGNSISNDPMGKYLINHLKYTLLIHNPSANCGKLPCNCGLVVIILYTNMIHDNHIY